VVVVRTAPLSIDVMVTVAPTIAPPVLSVTAPITVPFEVCAFATTMLTSSVKITDKVRLIAFTDISPRVER